MAHKKVAKIIATAIVVNNLSSSVVLGKEVNLKDKAKDNAIIKQSLNESNKHSNFFKIEKIAENATDFIDLINDRNLESIKLSRDIKLDDVSSKGIEIKSSNIIIDGQGNNFYIPKLTNNLKKDFFILQGDGIVLKNINLILENEGDKNNNLITILGDNIILENVFVDSNGGTAVKVLDGKNVLIHNTEVRNREKKGENLKVENAQVILNNLSLKNKNGLGIEVLGKDSKLNLKGDIKIDSPIEIRAQLRDGGKINCDNNQLINEKRVFGYTYYDVAKESQDVKNKKEFLEAVESNIVKNIKLINNIDLRGNESDYYKALEKGKNIDKNNYYISM